MPSGSSRGTNTLPPTILNVPIHSLKCSHHNVILEGKGHTSTVHHFVFLELDYTNCITHIDDPNCAIYTQGHTVLLTVFTQGGLTSGYIYQSEWAY